MKKNQGFSLIELMVTMAMIGIIAGIAIPSYYKYMVRTARTDAGKSLDIAAACQEKYYRFNRTYTNNMADLVALQCASATSNDGFYNLAVTQGDANSFTLTATAVIGGQQENDTPCLAITLNSSGQRLPTACW